MKDAEWGRPETTLHIFISSPSDVVPERQAASLAVEEVNSLVGEKLGVSLRVRMWERFHPTGEKLMAYIERHLRGCDLFVIIFSRRFGTPPSPDAPERSGTEAEYDIAARLRSKSPTGNRPEVFAYFKKVADEQTLMDPGTELKQVLDFKERVKGSVLFCEYSTVEEFRFRFKDDLISWLLEITSEERLGNRTERKRQILERFFDLGASPGMEKSALLVYPSLKTFRPKTFGGVTHLLSYMVSEDFQAIHKLTKCLNIAGCQKVHATTTDAFDTNLDRFQNWVFLCLPRNRAGLDCLREIPLERRRFDLDEKTVDDPERRAILWTRADGQSVRVRSPQSLYLIQQRQRLGRKCQGPFAAVALLDPAEAAAGTKVDEEARGVRGGGFCGSGAVLRGQSEERSGAGDAERPVLVWHSRTGHLGRGVVS